MTKRAAGKFERKASDFYPTPAAAVEPLIPHLHRTGVKTFAEPCAGDGSLIKHLAAASFVCVVDADIVKGWDAGNPAMWVSDDYMDVDVVVSNPPWQAKEMRRIMEHQSTFVPAWFLIYSDWLFTHQSTMLVSERCTDIVPIGRVRWFPESKSVGFDNCCWIRLQADKLQPTIFWPMTK